MRVYLATGETSSQGKPFLSFIRKLRKDLINPVNPVKRLLDRIYRTNRTLFCFSGRKAEGSNQVETDITRFLQEAMKSHLSPSSTYPLDGFFPSFSWKLGKDLVNPVNPVDMIFLRSWRLCER